MKTTWRESIFLPAAATLLAVLAIPASAQPVNCTANGGVPPVVRAEGHAEPLGDFILSCTGGIPTPVGNVVPQVNFSITLNTNLTSHVTQNSSGADFSEALLLIDEPDTVFNPPQRPLRNCGHAGAPDNGVSGPGVCAIVSDGNPLHTYDGTGNTHGAIACDGVSGHPAANTYGCGRPNAYQGRMAASGSIQVQFLGVPFDPPGSGTRTFRFTNLRADAAALGTGGPHPIQASIGLNGPTAITINLPQQVIGYSLTGLQASVTTPGVVHIAEAYTSAFKIRNIAFMLANASFTGTNYVYNGGFNYPAQAAQNVPGTLYNAEDMFQWKNNGANAPPSPNPPAGLASGPVANLGNPLNSGAFAGLDTKPNVDGNAKAGTRIALTFTHTPSHATVTVPATIYLHKTASPLVNSGVMVLTTTNANGAGAFTAGGSTTINEGDPAVYEVLYADPFSIEFADIPVTVNHSGTGTKVSVSFAPFYGAAGADFATPTAAHPTPVPVPRFTPAVGTIPLN